MKKALAALIILANSVPGFTCENEPNPYDYHTAYDQDCSWALGITADTPPAPHTLVELPFRTLAHVAGDTFHWPYEVAVAGAPRRLGLHIWREGTGVDHETVGELAARLALVYAQMPPFIHQILPRGVVLSTRETGGHEAAFCSVEFQVYCDPESEGRHTIFMPASGTLEDDLTPKLWYEEILLHEFAHLFQVAYGALAFDDRRWFAAVDRDNGTYVTPYARQGGAMEDYAESFVAWLLFRREAYDHGIRRVAKAHIWRSMRWRVGYFDYVQRRITLTHPSALSYHNLSSPEFPDAPVKTLSFDEIPAIHDPLP